MKSPSEGFRNHVFTKREGTSLLVVVINTRTYPSIFLKNVELQLNRRCPAPPLGSEAHARASPSQLARGRGAHWPACAGQVSRLSERTRVSVGSRLHLGKEGPHAHAHTRASPASHSVYVDGPFCLRRSQPLNRPGKRNPRPLPNQATTPPSDSQRPGALPTHTCLSAGLTAWEGASPTFPCPSARLTGASRQETPPAPQFMAISTSDGHRRVGASPGPVGGQGGHVPPWVGPALRLSHRLG